MSIHKGKRTDIPEDAVIITEQEALQLQINLIHDWETKKDTWIFRHGFTVLSSMTALTSLYINSHYRRKFRLHNFGRASTYIPIVIIPSMLSAMFHNQFVLHDILIQKSCPVCVQVRSASLQALSSTIIPTIMAPLSAMPLAIRYFTYNIPPITSEPMRVFNLLYRVTKPVGNTLMGLLLFNGFLGGFIAYREMKSFLNLQIKIEKLENEFDAEKAVR